MKLALDRTLYDPDDAMGKMFFNILAAFAEFEADLMSMRTRQGMAIPSTKAKLRGKQPKPSDRQQRQLCRMHATGEYSISDLAELFTVSRPTVYRTLSQLRSEIGDGDIYRAFRVAEGLHENFYEGTLPAEDLALDLLDVALLLDEVEPLAQS